MKFLINVLWKIIIVMMIVVTTCWAWSFPPSSLNLWPYFTKPVLAGLGGLILFFAVMEDLFVERLKETMREVLKETKRNGVESNVKQ